MTELADELSELFREDVSVDGVTERELGGATVSVATISYRTSGETSKRYRQTAVILDDGQLNVPEFSLMPRPRGLLGKMMKLMGNLAAVEFADSPEFSEKYWLHAWAQDPVKILFTKPLRDYFVENSDWSIRAKRNRLVVFQSNHVCKETEIDDFVRDSLTILTLLQEGEEQLDERPEVRREVRPEDISTAASQMGGFAGKLLENQLRKISVTRQELEAFVAATPPRDIPPGMRRQVVGDNLPLVFVGVFFFVGGLFGGILWMLLAEGVFKLMGIPFLLLFPIAGLLMTFLTLRHRKRKTRTLREGVLTTGKVTRVARSNVTVNNQVRFHVDVAYQYQGKELSTACNSYGSAVDQAKALQDSGQGTRVLVDPEDETHVVCLDMLIVFD